jgi:hypothetical protein
MVDEGRLEVGGVSAAKVCMVAIAYHNLAVELMLKLNIEPALAASQSCLKVGTLCG